jgi:hypothetical protein
MIPAGRRRELRLRSAQWAPQALVRSALAVESHGLNNSGQTLWSTGLLQVRTTLRHKLVIIHWQLYYENVDVCFGKIVMTWKSGSGGR